MGPTIASAASRFGASEVASGSAENVESGDADPRGAISAPPRLLSQVTPEYPPEALAARASGTVTVLVTVGPDGSVIAVEAATGPEVFVASAQDAARKLRFEAALRNGVPVEATVPVHFRFEPPPSPLPTRETTEEIVVEERRIVDEDTHARETLTGEALERGRGQDLGESISRVPGVTTSRGTADATKPIIRGQYERRLLILFDGVRHESQKWGHDHAPEIDPFAAGEISVIKGAAGVRYGPDAIGGVVLVDPPPLRAEPGVSGKAQSVGVSNGLRGIGAVRVDAAPAALPGLALRVEGNYARGAALRSPTYVIGNTASEQWNGSATVQYRAGIRQLLLSYRHFDLRSGVCYCVSNSTPEDFQGQLEADKPAGADAWDVTYAIDRAYQAVAHDLVLARGLFVLGEAGILRTTYSFQLNRRREYERVRGSITGPQYDFTLRTHALDTHLIHAPIPLGASMSAEGSVGVSASVQENVYSGLPLVPNYRALGAGVFAVERVASGNVAAELGVRYDHQTRTSYLTGSAFERHLARGTLDEDDCERGPNAARCPKQFDAFSISAGGLWRPVEDLVDVRLDLSSASRFPNGDELYMNGSAPTFPVYALGDPSLGVETTWGASPTVGFRRKWLEAEASAYLNYIDDYIYFAPEIGPDGEPEFDVTIRGAFPRFGFRPVDALFYGFDGGVTIGPESPVSLAIQGAVVRAQEAATGRGLVFIPADRARASLTYRRPGLGRFEEVYVQGSGLFVAKQSQVDESADFAPPPAAYFLLGAAVGARIPLGQDTLTLGLEAENLLNTRYRDYTSLLRYYADEPGRELRLRLGLEF